MRKESLLSHCENVAKEPVMRLIAITALAVVALAAGAAESPQCRDAMQAARQAADTTLGMWIATETSKLELAEAIGAYTRAPDGQDAAEKREAEAAYERWTNIRTAYRIKVDELPAVVSVAAQACRQAPKLKGSAL